MLGYRFSLFFCGLTIEYLRCSDGVVFGFSFSYSKQFNFLYIHLNIQVIHIYMYLRYILSRMYNCLNSTLKRSNLSLKKTDLYSYIDLIFSQIHGNYTSTSASTNKKSSVGYRLHMDCFNSLVTAKSNVWSDSNIRKLYDNNMWCGLGRWTTQ